MKGIAAYQDNAITPQGQGRLIVMLYEGAIKFMKLAIREIEAENWEAKGKHIIKAQDILLELNTVLDMDAGGDIAQNLRKLYFYMGRRLTEANIQKDPEIIREVISLAEELNAGWKAIAN
jgi:flagellar protein FliS